MTDARERSPLAHRAPVASDAIRLAERPFEGLVVLRGEFAVVGPPFAAATGLELPRACRGTARGPGLSALWLAPDEWLLATPTVADAAARAAELGGALAGRHHQLVDVSDYYAVLELAGPAVRTLMAKLVTVDLHPRVFRRDQVVGTHLAKATVQLWLVADEDDGEGPAVRVVVRRSLADYVWCLVVAAGREWDLAPATPVGRVPLHTP